MGFTQTAVNLKEKDFCFLNLRTDLNVLTRIPTSNPISITCCCFLNLHPRIFIFFHWESEKEGERETLSMWKRHTDWLAPSHSPGAGEPATEVCRYVPLTGNQTLYALGPQAKATTTEQNHPGLSSVDLSIYLLVMCPR